MALATGFDGGKDPPGTPRVLDQLQRFRDTHLVFPFKNILLTTPTPKQIAITSPNMNPVPLNAVMPETVTASLDDYKKVVFVVDDVPLTPISSTPPDNIQEDNIDFMPLIPDPSLLSSSPSHISPPVTITAKFASKQSIVSSTSSNAVSKMSRVSQDPDGNPPVIIAAGASAAVNRSSNLGLSTTLSTHSREPAGSIAGSIERQVKRQNQQIEAVIQEIRPSRPDPLIATELSSIISGMTTPDMPPPSPSLHSSLPCLDLTLPTEWQGNLLLLDVELLHKIPIKYQDEIISYVDRFSSDQNLSGAGEVVA